MRKYGYLLFDMATVMMTLLIALYLRNGFPLIEDGRPGDTRTLLITCALTSLVVLPAMKTHTRMWRYTSAHDLWAIVIAAGLIVVLTNSGLFLLNRLEMVPRSVPPMHWALIIAVMAGVRLCVRAKVGPKLTESHHRLQQHVMIVGTGHVAELYIAFVKKIIPGQATIEGFVDEDPTLANRSFHQYPIHGTPDSLPTLLERMLVHGIRISKLIVTRPMDSFRPATQKALLELERSGLVELVHFEQQIGLYRDENEMSASAAQPETSGELDQTEYNPPQGTYTRFKRASDIVIAGMLLTLCAPLLLLTGFLVYLDVGLPLLFWQKRPGRFGQPFRIYKFRTMRPAGRKLGEDRLEHKIGDANRTSFVGKMIRQFRLDELPQLYHIFMGTMSFVGPRPLLPDDQPEGGEQRLSVRPGITGWAQVNGGDALTAGQKRVLDLWYIQNMSLWLDLKILLLTAVVIFQEDRANRRAIDMAARDLKRAETIAPEQKPV